MSEKSRGTAPDRHTTTPLPEIPPTKEEKESLLQRLEGRLAKFGRERKKIMESMEAEVAQGVLISSGESTDRLKFLNTEIRFLKKRIKDVKQALEDQKAQPEAEPTEFRTATEPGAFGKFLARHPDPRTTTDPGILGKFLAARQAGTAVDKAPNTSATPPESATTTKNTDARNESSVTDEKKITTDTPPKSLLQKLSQNRNLRQAAAAAGLLAITGLPHALDKEKHSFGQKPAVTKSGEDLVQLAGRRDYSGGGYNEYEVPQQEITMPAIDTGNKTTDETFRARIIIQEGDSPWLLIKKELLRLSKLPGNDWLYFDELSPGSQDMVIAYYANKYLKDPTKYVSNKNFRPGDEFYGEVLAELNETKGAKEKMAELCATADPNIDPTAKKIKAIENADKLHQEGLKKWLEDYKQKRLQKESKAVQEIVNMPLEKLSLLNTSPKELANTNISQADWATASGVVFDIFNGLSNEEKKSPKVKGEKGWAKEIAEEYPDLYYRWNILKHLIKKQETNTAAPLTEKSTPTTKISALQGLRESLDLTSFKKEQKKIDLDAARDILRQLAILRPKLEKMRYGGFLGFFGKQLNFGGKFPYDLVSDKEQTNKFLLSINENTKLNCGLLIVDEQGKEKETADPLKLGSQDRTDCNHYLNLLASLFNVLKMG